jgi:membrane associated rhomboid family serine protease
MFSFNRLTKLTKYLIIINISFWIIEVLLLRFDSTQNIIKSLFLYPEQVMDGKVWQLLTYSFFHDPSNIFHLILNMLVLFFFAYDLELKWGKRRFIFFYLISALVGGIFVLLESIIFIPAHYSVPTLGASGSIFALTTAFALSYPEKDIYLIVFPIKAKYLIHIDLGIILLSYLSISNSNVSNAAHLGGMASAFLLIKIPWYKLKKKVNKNNKREKVVDHLKRVK